MNALTEEQKNKPIMSFNDILRHIQTISDNSKRSLEDRVASFCNDIGEECYEKLLK